MTVTYQPPKDLSDYNHRYLAFTRVRGWGRPMWEYMDFMQTMVRMYCGVASSWQGHIQDHDAFTRFVEENAHRYLPN